MADEDAPKIMETLRVDLEPTEVIEYGRKLAVTIEDRDKTRESAKEYAATAAAEIKEMDNEARRLARIVRDRADYRLVEVEHRRDDAMRAIDTFRLDTGELVRSRPMNEQEKQMILFDIDKARKRKAKPDTEE